MALPTDAPPRTHREAHTVFFDYHVSRREARELGLNATARQNASGQAE
jgi:hypothetical protein